MPLISILAALATFPECPDQAAGCPGTANERVERAVAAARSVDLNAPWPSVREEIVRACGLRVQGSTGHCFNDWNHVDCCAMESASTHRTNEDALVPGMHAVNQLGPHIVEASEASFGGGGSWCTCQMSAPYDVCHKQFGARTAFKLVWCEGTGVAALVDDYGNALAAGKPLGGAAVPDYGGARARADAWRVLAGSSNKSWATRWAVACDRAARGEADEEPATLGRHGDEL